MAHHGNNPEQEKALSEAMRKLFGEYPDGRFNAERTNMADLDPRIAELDALLNLPAKNEKDAVQLTNLFLAKLNQAWRAWLREAAINGDGCICHGNWRTIVKEYESSIGEKFRDHQGTEFRFFGIVHADDDYYYGMYRQGALRLLSCVGSIEGYGFTAMNPKGGQEQEISPVQATEPNPGSQETAPPVGPDIAERIRIGCRAANVHLDCTYPGCGCKQIPSAILAALRGGDANASEHGCSNLERRRNAVTGAAKPVPNNAEGKA